VVRGASILGHGNRRRSSDPPPLQIRQFTPDQGDWAIKLLTPRADEVKALDPKEIPYHDERVRTAERKIRTTILEIFGEIHPSTAIINTTRSRKIRYHNSGAREPARL
jgi:hypothetical protein